MLNSIITWIIVVGIAGFLAEQIIGGIRTGCIGTVIVGVVGALIGGWLFAQLGHCSRHRTCERYRYCLRRRGGSASRDQALARLRRPGRRGRLRRRR